MHLYLARHGETDLNIDERYQGRSDAPLNARGLAQAEALAAALPAGLQNIVASPLLRARQTAQAVSRQRGLPVTLMAGLAERDFGAFDGLTLAEVQARWPALWAAGVATAWDLPPPGGESTRAVVQRVSASLAGLQAQHAGQTVLLVVHGFVIRALRYLLDGLTEPQFFDAPKLGNGQYIERQVGAGYTPK